MTISNSRQLAASVTCSLLASLSFFAPALAIDLSQGFSNANVGEVGGAVAGGVGGNYLAKKGKLGKTGQLAATIGGTIAGGMLGNVLGGKLDSYSRQRATSAQQNAITTGSVQSWQGEPNSGASGQVQPGHPYKTAEGICRDFTHTIRVEGRAETARGIACRNADGTWNVQG